MDAFHALDPRNIPKDLRSVYGEKEIDLIYDFYGLDKINIFQGQRDVATAIIIKCSKENLIDQVVRHFRLMSNKKALDDTMIAKNVAAPENKLRQQEKKKSALQIP